MRKGIIIIILLLVVLISSGCTGLLKPQIKTFPAPVVTTPSTTTPAPTPQPVCGNSIVESGEECDGNGCPTGRVCTEKCKCEIPEIPSPPALPE